MTADYIVKNIYPLIWQRELGRKIDFWREILHDEWNKHLHERAKREIRTNLEKIDKGFQPVFEDKNPDEK